MGLDHLEINVTGLSLLGHVLHRLSGSRSHQGEDVRSRSDQLDCFLTAQHTTQQDNKALRQHGSRLAIRYLTEYWVGWVYNSMFRIQGFLILNRWFQNNHICSVRNTMPLCYLGAEMIITEIQIQRSASVRLTIYIHNRVQYWSSSHP